MSRPPNILLITSDQQHHRALGLHTPVLQTPNLDRLAAEGTLFERAYCNNPLCSPSRSTIITGRYPAWHGCWTLGVKLDESEPNIADMLGSAGYATSLIGKAHFQPTASTPDQTSLEAHPTLGDLDFWRSFHGPFYGFDRVELARNHGDESLVGQHYAIWLEEKGPTDWRRHFRSWPPTTDEPRRHGVWSLPAELHYSVWTAERAISAIESAVEEGRPFFCWVSYHDPHPPYLTPDPYASMYNPEDVEPGRLDPDELERMPPWMARTQERDPDFSDLLETPFYVHGLRSHVVDEYTLRTNIAIYYGMLTLLDEQVGRILGRLDALGVTDDTLVVFTTDHGHFLGQHGLTTKGPFHYEDMLRLPMLVRFPGRVPRGRRSSGLQALVDLAPTFLAAAGLPPPTWMQGVDQLPVWRGESTSARDDVIVENRQQPTTVHLRTYIDERYKLTVHRGRRWGELFDLQEDPDELHNLFADPSCLALRAELMHRFLDAELRREPMRYPRIAGA